MENEFILETYLEKSSILNGDRLEKILSELSNLSKSCLSCEEKIRDNLISEAVSLSYPKIDVSFLSMNIKKRFYEKETQYQKDCEDYLVLEANKQKFEFDIPKFAIYNINNQKNEIHFGFSEGDYFIQFINPKMPFLFRKTILKSFNFPNPIYHYQYDADELYKIDKYMENTYFQKLPKEFRKLHKESGIKKLSSSFDLLIPSKTKQTIEQAKPFFGDEIYFIKEMKPEEWNLERFIKEDPIVIGVNKENAFYIDKFDPTPLEGYFSEKNLKQN